VLIKALEDRDPNTPVLFQNNRSVTAGELASKASTLAGALASRKILEGDRVALLLPNCRELVLALAACARIGAIAAPLDPAATAPELVRLLAPLEPRCVFALSRGVAALTQALAASDFPPPLVVRIDHEVAGAPGSVHLDELLEVRLPVPPRPPERTLLLAHAAWRGRGRPHFALLGADAAYACALAAARATGVEAATRGGGALLAAAPFFRAPALAIHVIAPILLGFPVVVLKQLRARMALRLAHAHGVRVVVAPPALLNLMARMAVSGPGRPLESLRLLVATAAPRPDATTVDLVETAFGSPLVWGYGSAEAPWALAVPEAARGLPPAERGLGEPIGRDVHVRAVAQGVEVAPGEEGAIHVAAPWAARELLGASREDLPAPLGAPTGDRGVRGARGLELLPREDVATVAAFEVDLAEVGAALAEHPSVASAQAYSVPDPETGSHLGVVVTLARGKEASVAQLVDFVRERLSYYKVPFTFRFKVTPP
jgi:acyl-coenzyme A synthetase/AMP-(fatty) acid ligase